MATEHFSVGDVAKLYRVQDWQVRRSVDGLKIELQRIGRNRLIPRSLLPKIAAELRARGWLTDTTPTPVRGGRAG